MKTVSASDANRKFSQLLRDVGHGEVITVLSRGKPVAVISPARANTDLRESARRRLIERLKRQKVTGRREWSRQDLYE